MTKNHLIEKIIDNCNNFPNKKILFDETKSFTYLKLLNLAFLNAQNIKKLKSPYVPLIISRNIESVVGILSIVMANKAFCPISEGAPKERIKLILKKLNCRKYVNCSKKKINLPGEFKIRKSNRINIYKKIFFKSRKHILYIIHIRLNRFT